jgi:hypothetical protein
MKSGRLLMSCFHSLDGGARTSVLDFTVTIVNILPWVSDLEETNEINKRLLPKTRASTTLLPRR